MDKIKLLDNHTINKIAAGEVIERPSSVVKELVENSIDAGATTITVEIKEGGISYIRVSDNGCGIPKEDVKTAFIRHATNKIKDIEDLESIMSLGFRGEALASIAAISQLEMVTKTAQEPNGVKIEIQGGSVTAFQDIGCGNGTSIIMRNIFYNVPARRKFLKRPGTESGYIADILYKLALGHPEISFKYINNESVILHTSGNHDLKTAIFHVYGKEVSNNIIEVSAKKNEFLLTGFIGKPELARANRSYENLFINGRFVKSSLISSAVEQAYKTRLMNGKFPITILNFTIPPDCIDVNVHPTKLEVRFAQEDEIYQLVYCAVVKALGDSVLIPKVEWDSKPIKKEVPEKLVQEQLFEAEDKEEKPVEIYYADLEDKKESIPKLPKINNACPVVKETAATYRIDHVNNSASLLNSKQTTENKDKKSELSIPFFQNYKIIGQIFNTYWLIEQNNSIFLIDQHAAHERVLFEQLTMQFKKQSIVAQQLLQPVAISLTPKERQLLQDNVELLRSFGFSIEEFSNHEAALTSVPFIFHQPSNIKFFTEILDSLELKSFDNVYESKIHSIATMACKAAVKAHDKLDYQEAKALVEQLLNLENPFTCPHGRPTIIEMTKYELEKKFKRIL